MSPLLLTITAQLWLGLAALATLSHSPSQVTTANSREVAGVSAETAGSLPLSIEPLAQCSRRTPLVISEIMYRPPKVLLGTNEAQLEYLELFNSRSEPEDLSGYRLSGAIDYTFPTGTVIPGGGFVVVARAPADLQAVYGLASVLGPWVGAATNGLPNNDGVIRLRHRTDAAFLEVHYSSQPPWPIVADGAGHSLVLARPSYGEGDPRAWAASDMIGGSPGRGNPVTTDPLDGVLINEYLAHTDPPLEDYVELYNRSNQPKDLSGAWLSDEPTNKFRIPNGVVLPPRGWVVFTESTLGFALRSAGERLYLVNPARTRVVDAVGFGPQEKGISSGRVPDGGPAIERLAELTPGAKNAAALPCPIVINEIMYQPLSGEDDDQYVELHNRTDRAVDLSGWRFTSGIGFAFPPKTILAAQSYLVAARNAARLRTNYANLNSANCLGDFQGRLSHSGERLALAAPHVELLTNGTQRLTNMMYVVVQDLTYGTGGRWPQWTAAGGSSLELRDPRSDNRQAANWAGSEETLKAPWTLIERRGVVDNASATADQLQVLAQGAGEFLIDNVEVLNASGANLIANSTFEGGAAGWTAEGTLSLSSAESTAGFNSSRSYHVRAVDRGDNQINRLRTPLTTALANGATATLRARVRWLRGHPGVLLRLRGNGLELAAQMALPIAPGTPGTRNSRWIANAPPAVYDVTHEPVLPAANEPVRVTARLHDPDSIAAAEVSFRVDPGTSYSQAPLRDDGTGGDAIAGDGWYTATIPGQAGGALVAFYVQATDAAQPAATARFPDTAPAHECLIRFRENVPTGNLPVYRLWMTQATFNAWGVDEIKVGFAHFLVFSLKYCSIITTI